MKRLVRVLNHNGHEIPELAEQARVLPAGWSQEFTPDGTIYYKDHTTQTTAWEPPPALEGGHHAAASLARAAKRALAVKVAATQALLNLSFDPKALRQIGQAHPIRALSQLAEAKPPAGCAEAAALLRRLGVQSKEAGGGARPAAARTVTVPRPAAVRAEEEPVPAGSVGRIESEVREIKLAIQELVALQRAALGGGGGGLPSMAVAAAAAAAAEAAEVVAAAATVPSSSDSASSGEQRFEKRLPSPALAPRPLPLSSPEPTGGMVPKHKHIAMCCSPACTCLPLPATAYMCNCPRSQRRIWPLSWR